MVTKFHPLLTWFHKSFPKTQSRPTRVRPQLVGLEDRSVPANFTILNTNDAGVGSLRQAVLDATANTEDDRIDFDFALGGMTVTLLTPVAVTDTAKAIEIAAPLPATISGGGATQLFTVAAGANFKLSSLTLTGGKGNDGVTGQVKQLPEQRLQSLDGGLDTRGERLQLGIAGLR